MNINNKTKLIYYTYIYIYYFYTDYRYTVDKILF